MSLLTLDSPAGGKREQADDDNTQDLGPVDWHGAAQVLDATAPWGKEAAAMRTAAGAMQKEVQARSSGWVEDNLV